MAYYGSATRSVTETYTQARRLAARIAAELKQLQALYGRPSDDKIEEFAEEIESYIRAGYLDHVRYGFRRGDEVILELKYTAEDATGIDDKPGRIPVGVDISGAQWFSYLEQNYTWSSRSQSERDAFERELPFTRTGAPTPTYAYDAQERGSKHYSEDTLGLRREVRSI
jgi:hypothetical protein